MRRILLMGLALVLACSCNKNAAPAGEFTLPAPQDVVMYQVNPRNFAPSESFKAVEARLPEIRDLGANVVWFMPICEIGKEKSVSSPYCVKDYCAVNPEFGTLDDFKSLVAKSHSLGMAVIMDWVANHTSWDNQWIKDHPEWYTKDEKGNIIPPAGTGWNDVADLDFDNPEMRLEMIKSMSFWVNEVGVDGFRCDAADFVPFEFWKQCVEALRAIEGKELLLLAEGQRKDHFDAGFDMNYAWGWLGALRRVYTGRMVQIEGGNRPGRNGQPRPPRMVNRKESVATLFHADSLEYAGLGEGKVKLRFTTNHDEHVKDSPVKEFFGNDGSMAAFVATTFLHGGMLIYGCQEVGYPGKINFFEYVDVDWDANPQMLSEYKKLVSIYSSEKAVRRGGMTPYPDEDVLVFERTLDGESVLVMVNLRDTQRKIAPPAPYVGKTVKNLMTGDSVTLPKECLLRPFQYLILK